MFVISFTKLDDLKTFSSISDCFLLDRCDSMVANLESNEIMSDSSHGDHRHSSDDRHESNHEFNMFLDREIQKSLLGISDKLADNDARGINIFLGLNKIHISLSSFMFSLFYYVFLGMLKSCQFLFTFLDKSSYTVAW